MGLERRRNRIATCIYHLHCIEILCYLATTQFSTGRCSGDLNVSAQPVYCLHHFLFSALGAGIMAGWEGLRCGLPLCPTL